ncbi:MAG: acetate kinase [Bacillota bacterium]|jgi:acetate kinase|nr:acetate kinase [Bacillota bacterium]MDD3297507.1 acetate kinase [Bacillota bacterium]MDD3851073.1 acetate kinase [Bacillota bacterium]MDD4706903.1 acetate kinase [Bacillota bacterium]
MKVLVVNCGSSSVKYQLLNMEDESVMARGLVERIGIEGSRLKHQASGKDEVVIEKVMPDHKAALKVITDVLIDEKDGVIKDTSEISAVGHRVVHGGEKFSGSVKITEEVMDTLRECADLAPLHNPPNIMGVEACRQLMPGIPMAGTFDTAFHHTIPDYAYIYPIPYEYYDKYGVRKYGFHGTSHKYVSERAAQVLGKPLESLKIITCHLGNGASITAVDGGVSVETSMGFTPLEGLAMGTRCGSIDPAIIAFLMEKEQMTIDEVNNVLNKRSGVKGISGVSSDFRDLEQAAGKGDKRAALAIDVFAYKVKKFIGSYSAVMNGVDVIVFTAGLGENSISMREKICSGLGYLGLELDPEANNVRGKEAVISKPDCKVKAVVIPTNEELMIARDTMGIIG